MGLFDNSIYANARRGRELAVHNAETQARGFNMILNKLDEISNRLEHIEFNLQQLQAIQHLNK